MKNTNSIALLAMQVVAVSGGSAEAFARPAAATVPNVKTQIAINRLSLASIEKSWLAIPRMCKAAGFNAQPRPIDVFERSAEINSLYERFSG